AAMDLDPDTDQDMEPDLLALLWAALVSATLALLVIAYKLGLLHHLIYKVSGGGIVANVLKAHDVKFVFTLVGGHISPILVACEKIGIRVVDTRHEVTAVYAADAVARLSGPVFVEFPIDVLYPYHIVNKNIAAKSGSGIVSKLLKWYLQMYLQNLFVGAWEPTDISPLPVVFPKATVSEMQRCVELVSRAKRPVIVLGSQVMLPPTPAQSLREALEYLGFPCFLGGMARGMLGKNNSIHIRNKRADVLKKADLVILAGTVCDFRLSYGRILSKHSNIIAVNRDHKQLLKNSDMFWKPKIAIQGDAGSFLVKLANLLTGYTSPLEWTWSLKEEDKKIDKINRTEKMLKYLNPLNILYCLDEIIAEDSIIVADGGDFVGSSAYILHPRGPLQWLDPGAFGTLGVGGGFALGAKLCRPKSEVWIIYGDGSVGYSIAEFDTFKRHKAPIIALVGNDACWSQISREQVPMLGSSVACNLAYTDYHIVAEGYGGKGYLLNTANENHTEDLLMEAKMEAHGGNPILINVLIGKSNFREGSLSV
uniref:2-hydroxyacyl-CoA lyase 2 n=1 Tax=Callorhinchus milii TaxID=7868 RepID=A0A4W3HFZ7_CALMI